MPFRDRAGRRILCIFPGAKLQSIPKDTHVSSYSNRVQYSTAQYSTVQHSKCLVQF
jgi:hypothetical protein